MSNSNKKKNDPFFTILKLFIILVIILVGLSAISYLCSLLIKQDYTVKNTKLLAENEVNQIKFNTELSLMAKNIETTPDEPEEQREIIYFEKTLGDVLYRIEDDSHLGLENTSSVTLDRYSLLQGGLLLVNSWHSIPEDYSTAELISIGTQSGYKIQVHDNSVQILPVAFNALEEMLNAALVQGQDYYIVREGYRSIDRQTELFQNQMEELNDKYSGDILIEEAKKVVNYPGTSDYHTGLSVRMDLYKDDEPNYGSFFQTKPQGIWLTENAWKYGFVFRFPTRDFPNSSWEDKSYKTGVSLPLNLYRFVGKAHSTAMRILDHSLEEYLEFLIAHPHITIYQDGALLYEIVRIPVSPSDTSYLLPVPNQASSYQASLDNLGGAVMAYTY